MGYRKRVQVKRPHHGFERVSYGSINYIYECFLTSISGPHLRFRPRTMLKGVRALEHVDVLRPMLQSRSVTVSTMETL
jgi:hypothetical protein